MWLALPKIRLGFPAGEGRIVKEERAMATHRNYSVLCGSLGSANTSLQLDLKERYTSILAVFGAGV